MLLETFSLRPRCILDLFFVSMRTCCHKSMVVPFSFLNKKNQNKTSSENVQELTNKLMSVFHVQCNMSNTRNSVSLGYPNTERRNQESRKYNMQRSIFDKIRGVWIVNETLSRVFDISSQSKQKLRSKRRSKIIKIYAN